jgi:hypothetical protein
MFSSDRPSINPFQFYFILFLAKNSSSLPNEQFFLYDHFN